MGESDRGKKKINMSILAVGPSKDGLVLNAIMTAISIIYLII